MRVKSRKPPAALSKYAAASGRAASSATRVNARTCGRCETAAKIAIVAIRGKRAHARAARLPHRGDARDRVAIRFRQRREDHAPVVEQRRERGGRAAVLGARDRMARHEAAQLGAECVARGSHDVLLGAAGIGHARAGTEVGRDLREQRRELRDRRRDEDDVRVVSLRPPVGVERQRAIDDAALHGRVEVRAGAPDTDDLARPRPARLSANAQDPPMRPTPTTTSFCSFCTTSRGSRAARPGNAGSRPAGRPRRAAIREARSSRRAAR